MPASRRPASQPPEAAAGPLPRRMRPTDAVFWYAEEVSPGMRGDAV